MNNFGVYYAVYNNKKATEFVLYNFRKHFPNQKICLISDGGDDFTDIAYKYNTEYFYLDNIFSSGPINCYNADRTIKWWQRQKLVCDTTKADYVMILEDDVYITRGFDLGSHFCLKGIAKHETNQFTYQMIQDIYSCSGIINDYYGMCGGSIYNAKIFNIIYDDVILDIQTNHDRLLNNNFYSYHKMAAVDANITYHFNKRGYPYSKAEWITEDIKNPENKPVIHTWKELYV